MAQGIFGLDRVYKKQVQNVTNDNFESWPESATYGYFVAGIDPAVSPAYVDTVDRIDFSSETRSLLGDNLPQGRSRLAPTSSDFYGYFGAGYNNPGADTVDRIDFSSETFSAPGNNLSKARWYLAAVSN